MCGRICNRRYEDACTCGTVDQAVAIDAVKKFVAQQDLNAARSGPAGGSPLSGEMAARKFAIIGRPGRVCKVISLRCRATARLYLEKNEHQGGMLRYGIPSFKLEKDVIDAEIDILRSSTIRCGVEVGKDVTLAQLRAQGYKAFYSSAARAAAQQGFPARTLRASRPLLLLRTVGGTVPQNDW